MQINTTNNALREDFKKENNKKKAIKRVLLGIFDSRI